MPERLIFRLWQEKVKSYEKLRAGGKNQAMIFGAEQSIEITDYPLSDNYTAGRNYIEKRINWKSVSLTVDEQGFAQFDVSDVIDLFPRLALDDGYRLICYVSKEYHGLWGRVAAVPKGEPAVASAKDGIWSAFFHGPELELPDCAAPPMEAIYRDGSPEGFLDAIICEQILSSLPYARYEDNHWEELIDGRPSDMQKSWNEWVYIPDWSIRMVPSSSGIDSIRVFCRRFENGYGSSDGLDRISLRSYYVVGMLDIYNHFSQTKYRTTMYKTHISSKGRYSEDRQCCVFGCNSIGVARQRDRKEAIVHLPEKELSTLVKHVDQMSSVLSNEVSEFLKDGFPRTIEDCTHLFFDRFSFDHRKIYEIDLPGMWNYINSDSPERNDDDSLYNTAHAIQRVVDRMHIVCSLRDDCVDFFQNDCGAIDKVACYEVLHQLAIQNNHLQYAHDCLKNAAEKLFLSEDSNEDDEIEPDSNELSLEDNESLAYLYNFIQDIFPYFISQKDPENPELIADYQKYILHSLELFFEGNGLEEFSFSFVRRELNEILWIEISTDGEDVLNVSEGGYLYTPGIGGDSYTNWRWSIWNSGEESGEFMLDTNSVAELIRAGAELSVELPEEYVYSEDD